MKKITFHKFHGAGNDFVIIDNMSDGCDLSEKEVEFLCHRHFGIGADGLLLLERSEKADLKLRYFNSNGREASLCGNGSRCATACALMLGHCTEDASVEASDGIHNVKILSANNNEWLVCIWMHDVSEYEVYDDGVFINTGSPHFVRLVSNDEIDSFDGSAESLRHDSRFEGGTNVDFYRLGRNGDIQIRTFERGVEAETLSCGTGVTATAIVDTINSKSPSGEYVKTLHTKGGDFEVRFIAKKTDEHYKFTDVRLIGPSKCVFSGTIIL